MADAVGDYLVEQTVISAGDSKSPIDGETWKKDLSPAYKKKKRAEGLPGKANLEEEGGLLDDLTYKRTSDGIKIGWFGDEAAKADGHANISGDSTLPQRRLIPDAGQEYKPAIQQEIEKIVADTIADELEIDPEDFGGVESKAGLYAALEEYFPGMSRADLRALVARSPSIAATLDDLGLFELL